MRLGLGFDAGTIFQSWVFSDLDASAKADIVIFLSSAYLMSNGGGLCLMNFSGVGYDLEVRLKVEGTVNVIFDGVVFFLFSVVFFGRLCSIHSRG